MAGNGYTNHCSAGLWSMHVDVHPGVRAATCRALMEPVQLLHERGDFVMLHRCVGCGYERRNRTSPNDNIDVIL